MAVAKEFPAYLAGLASWFIPLGIQTVLFPWLVAVVLRMDAFAVGLAQMALMAPSILFMPLGGLVADRGNPRRLLIRYHLLYALPPVALAAVIWQGGLSYPLLICYGLVVGAISAYAVPTRDALLSTVAKGSLPSAVALVTALQFLGQLVGIGIASTADRFGAPLLLVFNACLLVLGSLAVAMVSNPPPHPPTEHPSYWRSIVEGVEEAARADQIWPVLLLNLGIGLFYIGPFLAVMPLVVRDVHGGGAAEIAFVNLAFLGGTIVAAFAFAGFAKRVSLRGRMMILSLSGGALILAAMGAMPPLWLLCLLCFVWGLGAGITLTQGRTVLQIVAPPTHRARLMSLFQLGFAGGGPIGALLAGSIAAVWGLQAALIAPAIAMAFLIVAVVASSRIWSMRTVEELR
jgi:MFS family permease